jgi:ketosteroid isomerase-like protein
MIKSLNSFALAAVALMPLSLGPRRFVESYEVQPASTSAALAVAAQFHDLLSRGDSAGAARWLASDAIVLESGDLETRAEYVAHHLGEDIAFAKAVPSTRAIVQSRRDGNVVWITATSVSKGRFGDRQIDSRGTELMILSQSGSKWLIRAIHWSSRRAPPT